MNAPLVHLVDWGGGNLASVVRAFERLGASPRLTDDPDELAGADRVVLPGVGAFGAVMAALDARGLREVLRDRAVSGVRPLLGICVGLQVLFEGSEESPEAAGLSVLPAEVVRLRARKVPHIGWNEVVPTPDVAARGVVERGYAYFVNSYAAPAPTGAPWVAATTDHEGLFASAVAIGATLALQFHPEKSGAYGARLLERWLEC